LKVKLIFEPKTILPLFPSSSRDQFLAARPEKGFFLTFHFVPFRFPPPLPFFLGVFFGCIIVSFYDAGCALGRLTQAVLEGRECESVAIFRQRRLGGSKLIKDEWRSDGRRFPMKQEENGDPAISTSFQFF